MTTCTLWRDAVDSRTNGYVRQRMRHFRRLRASYVEQWLSDLAEVSVPTLLEPLSAAERDLLIDEHWRRDMGKPRHPGRDFDPLVQRLDHLVLRAQERSPIGAAFVRLGSGAPLDSTLLMEHEHQIDSGLEALEVLLESQRTFDDLCLAQECGYLPSVVVRPWEAWAEGAELRAVCRDGELLDLGPRGPGPLDPRAEAAFRARLAPRLARRFPGEELRVDAVLVGGEAWLVDVSPLLPERQVADA